VFEKELRDGDVLERLDIVVGIEARTSTSSVSAARRNLS